MFDGRSVGVVVPGYNEEGFIGTVIETVPSFVDAVYVVDDCSTDGTWAEIQHYIPKEQVGVDAASGAAQGTSTETRVVAFRHHRNRGRGGAVKTGYRAALADEIDVIAVMDGDGQMDPAILEEIVDPVVRDEADYVVGNRLAERELRAGMPRFRLFGNLLLTVLMRVASGDWSLSDPQNGYTAISKRALAMVDLDALYEDYGFLNDLLVRLNVHGLRVVNVPMRARYGDEESGIRYATFVPKLSLLLCRLFLARVVLWRLQPVRYTDRTETGQPDASLVRNDGGQDASLVRDDGERDVSLVRNEYANGFDVDETPERIDEL